MLLNGPPFVSVTEFQAAAFEGFEEEWFGFGVITLLFVQHSQVVFRFRGWDVKKVTDYREPSSTERQDHRDFSRSWPFVHRLYTYTARPVPSFGRHPCPFRKNHHILKNTDAHCRYHWRDFRYLLSFLRSLS